MRYWVYFIAKLGVAGVLLFVLRGLIVYMFPRPDTFLSSERVIQLFWRPEAAEPQSAFEIHSAVRPDPFTHDLAYTVAMLLFTLFAVGVVWLIVWDQRYRCRTCLRRLRMPILTGAWTQVLFGAPRTEYICPYGHGTLRVAELQITGRQYPDWEPHDDIWKELYSLEETKK